MRTLRTFGSIAATGLLIAACGSSVGATGAGSTAAAGPTDAAATQDAGNEPGSTDSGAGGGGVGSGTIDTSHGKAHFEVTGAKTASGDLGFFNVTSVWGVNGDGSALLYWVDTGSTSLTISYSAGQGQVIFATSEFGVTLIPFNGVVGTCTVNMTTLDASSAAGTFNCEHMAIVGNDAVIGEGSISGSFDGHK